ncbi:MAG TPA: DUF4118 domain-containing protein, partial [Candidatus Cybelea sp.]|nr:DUF4118 domain-containing protein [Candidatus Cybelea sp.]
MDETHSGGSPTPAPSTSSAGRGKQGRLKIFLGMAPGVGKTTAMLRAAVAEKLAGRDVVVALAQAHGDRAVEILAGRLPRMGRPSANDMNLDEVLARRPGIAVVDELACVNPAEARHPQRFQDVLELLEAGIDVYTTLNVYEIASRAYVLRAVAGGASGQTVPDTMLDRAVMVLVDLPPSELIARRRNGQVRASLDSRLNFDVLFEEGRLTELREMAARMFAEQVARDSRERRQASRSDGPAKTGHRILVGVEADWDAEQLILWTRRLAGSLAAPWIVLYVETARSVTSEEESRLTRSLELARELGAEIITTASEDFVEAVLRAAASRNVTQIVAAKVGAWRWWQPFRTDRVVGRLIENSGEIGVYVVPRELVTRPRNPRRVLADSGWRQYLAAIGAAGGVALAGFLFTPPFGPEATALFALLAIVLLALFVESGPVLVAAAMIAVIWDYFFFAPVLAFRISRLEDGVLLAMYFVVAMVLGQLTSRLRAQEAGERQRERRATILYLLGRELAEATTLPQIAHKVVAEMERCLDAKTAILLADEAGRLRIQPGSTLALEENDQAIADWVMQHKQPAGKFTGNLPRTEAMFVPLESSHSMIGVLGLRLGQTASLSIHQQNLLEALARQIALALDRQRLSEIS